MLSALMYNKKTARSVKKYQKAIFKELFGHKRGGFLKFGLKEESDQMESGDKPILVTFCITADSVN